MRNTGLSTPPVWAFPTAEYAGNTKGDGWDVEGSAGWKRASIPAGTARVSVGNGENSTDRESSNNGGRSMNAKGASSPKAADQCCSGAWERVRRKRCRRGFGCW